MIKYYKVVAYRNDDRWIVAKLIESLEEAEAYAARMRAVNPGVDFYVE